MTPSRILITGINGLIGGVLHTALAEKYDVYGMDESGPFSGRVVSADISDYQQVARVFENSPSAACDSPGGESQPGSQLGGGARRKHRWNAQYF